jgi:hypothetical protein
MDLAASVFDAQMNNRQLLLVQLIYLKSCNKQMIGVFLVQPNVQNITQKTTPV